MCLTHHGERPETDRRGGAHASFALENDVRGRGAPGHPRRPSRGAAGDRAVNRAMDRYAAAGDEAADRARQQERHYQLLSALQSLVKELPRCAATGGGRTGAGAGAGAGARAAAALTRRSTRSSFQQRLSYTTLSDLALALLDGTVFEIVQGLLEIQHLTEKSLYNQRLRLQNEHRGAGGDGTFPRASLAAGASGQGVQSHADPFSLLSRNFLLAFPRVPTSS